VRGEKLYSRKSSEEKSVPTQMVGIAELRNITLLASTSTKEKNNLVVYKFHGFL
jgi:hypothetical protein